MSSTTTFLAVLVVFLIALNVGQYYYWTEVHEEEEEVLNISDLFGEDFQNWEDFVGKDVTVQGYYVNDSTPMLVSNLDLVMLDLDLPEDSYLPLTGDVTINGTLYNGAFVEIDGTVRSSSDVESRQYSVERPLLEYKAYKVILPPISVYYPWIDRIVVKPPQFTLSTRYAVLISGGINAAKNYQRYWNDMKFMYSILINIGYDADNIKVIYADGVGRDGDMPVNYSATLANVQTVFNELEAKMDGNDHLFLFLNDHGSGFWENDPYGDYLYGGRPEAPSADETDSFNEANFGKDFNGDGDTNDILEFDEALNLWGNDKLYDDDLAAMLDDLTYSKIIVFMKQCFSGGFVRDLSGPNRVILASCDENEPSWSADTEGTYGEFSYHFMSAVNEQTPGGVAVDADTDGMSGISMVEAFNYASDHDSRSETPFYDDNGDGVGHDGPIPEGGDGVIGDNTYLEPIFV
ncbi:MAG: C13 family peptidase [Candidatus Wukongarchaeota archaeon]|nr:C13 family peptidase [Candidatus Wukongarchaeota archaeon]